MADFDSPAVYGKTDGVLKPLDEALLPDPRFKHLVMETPTGLRGFQLSDMHARLAEMKLSSTVPDAIRRQFETARNLMLYAWLVFEFQTVAELQAYSTLEFALRERLGNPKKKRGDKLVPLMLRDLLAKAVRESVIVADRLPTWERVQEQRKLHSTEAIVPLGVGESHAEWLANTIKSIPSAWNRLAHGTPQLYLYQSLHQLALCGDLINELFSEMSAP